MIGKRRISIFIFAFIFFAGGAKNLWSQDYWVFFKDKNGSAFDPYVYFDAKAIERRFVINYCLDDPSDFPISPAYIETVACAADSVIGESRWFNAVAVRRPDIEKIKRLPFVNSVREIIYTRRSSICAFNDEISERYSFEVLMEKQKERMGGLFFERENINGKGVRVAVFDAGFTGVDKHAAFSRIRKEKRIIKTYDFVKKKNDVYNYDTHGAMAFSAIGGEHEGRPIGLATGAEFLLARTELSDEEPFSEELNWLAAAEWADKLGADVINSSLGYTDDRYTYKDMNGHNVFVTRAANLAVAKGMLVVNAAGNEGSNGWKYVAAPADGDSVLAVGGIDPLSDKRISFSSIGPTFDNRLKPNVCAYGVVAVCGGKDCIMGPGTSFSCPLVTGFAACVKQKYPQASAMELFRIIEKSGDLYPYFDYAFGFGVPQAQNVLDTNRTLKKITPTFETIETTDTLRIRLSSDAPQAAPKQILYHIQSPEGSLLFYDAMAADKAPNFAIDKKRYKGCLLRVFYAGFIREIRL